MPKGDKYASLTEFLFHCGQKTVRMTFTEIDKLCGLPQSAYKHPPAWSNASQMSFTIGWLLADYIVEDYSFSEQWVAFRHDPSRAKDYLARIPSKK